MLLTVTYGAPAGAAPPQIALAAPDPGATMIGGNQAMNDFDWWYGCAPTAGAMFAAWQEYQIKISTVPADLTAGPFAGNPNTWQYGKYPKIDQIYSQPGGDGVIDSTLFGVPDFANGTVSGWNHQYSAVWSGRDLNWVQETWSGHLPDSIADFMHTSTMTQGQTDIGADYPDPWSKFYTAPDDQHIYYNGTTASDTAWGLMNYMAWDDPRTPEIESYPMTGGTMSIYLSPTAGPPASLHPLGDNFGAYTAAIDAGQPTLVFLNSAESDYIEGLMAPPVVPPAVSTWTANPADPALDAGHDNHVVMGVGYYIDKSDPANEVDYLEVLTDWHQGVVQIPIKNIGGSNKWWASQFFTAKPASTSEPKTGLTGYFSVAAPDVSKLKVTIGVGNPAAPLWSTTAFDGTGSASQTGMSGTYTRDSGNQAVTYANLVMSDVNLNAALAVLASHPAEAGKNNNFYITVTDTDTGANVTNSAISDFQVRYNTYAPATPNGVKYNYVTGNRQTYFTTTGAIQSGGLQKSGGMAYATVNLDGEVHGKLFQDTNGNGIQDAGEPGLSGWTVKLAVDTNGDGLGEVSVPSDSPTTLADGSYSFSHVPAGEYILSETMKAGWGATTVSTSSANGTSPSTGTLTGKLYGQVLNNVNLGVAQYGKINGTIYTDLNQNGTMDAGETGGILPVRTVFLDANGNGILDPGELKTTTGGSGDGTYSFANLLPGTYNVVQQMPFGWVATNPASGGQNVTITSNQTAANNNFGSYLPLLPDLMDNNNGAGDSISPAAVAPGSAWAASFVIRNNGVGPSGPFKVRFYASLDTTITDPSSLDPTLVKDFVLGDVSMGGMAAGSTATATLNLPSFPQLPAGRYYVAAVVDYNKAVAESDETNNTIINSTKLAIAGITGRAWYDANRNGIIDASESGMANETIYVDLNHNGSREPNEPFAVTDINGNYSLPSLLAGSYTVREVAQPNWSYAAPATGAQQVTLVTDQLNSNVNFGNYRPNLPDLVDGGDAFSSFTPTSITSPGGKWDVFWDVKNQGTGDSGPFKVEFYLSTDNSMATPADNILLGSQDVPSIAAGGYADVNLSLLSFPKVANGNYYVGIVIDPTNQVFESNETNNTGIDQPGGPPPLAVTNLPDLTQSANNVGSFTPGTLLPGQPYNVNWSITNQGSLDATSFRVSFYLSANNVLDTKDTHLGTVTVNSLAAGATTAVNLQGFSMPDVPPGQYYVIASIDSAGQVQQNNWTDKIAIAANMVTVTVNTPAIQGTAFYDKNGNGVQDTLEPGLAGWTVYADLNANKKWDAGEPMAISDTNGHYWLQGLTAGVAYTIAEVGQDQWGQTEVRNADPTKRTFTYSDPTIMTLAAGETLGGMDFGTAPYSKIAGTIWKDGNGDNISDIGERKAYKPNQALLDGVRVNLFEDLNGNGRLDPTEMGTWQTTNSGNGGSYTFAGLLPGNYILYQDNAVVGGQAYVQTTSLAQTVSVEVNPNDATNSQLIFLDKPLPAQSVTITGAQLHGAVNFGDALPAEIDGVVWNDLNADGVRQPNEQVQAGVVVYLDQNLSNVVDPGEEWTTTAADGSYHFTGLRPGTYNVNQVRQPGWAQSLPGTASTNAGTIGSTSPLGFTYWQAQMNAGGKALLGDFGNYIPATIGGYIFHDLDADGVFKLGSEPGLAGGSLSMFLDSNGNGIQDVGEPSVGNYLDVNGNGIQDPTELTIPTLSDANGHYQFTGLVPGQYVLTETAPPQQAGGPWIPSTPVTVTLTVGSGDAIDNVYFGNYMYGHISGNVWHDLNADGTANAGELPLQGQTIYLDQNQNGKFDAGERFTLTDARGNYSFDNMIPGPFYVVQNLLPNWYQSSPPIATATPPILTNYYTVTLKSGDTMAAQNFGDYQYGQIQGTVWDDGNGDGVHQLAELPLADRTVYLDLNNDGVKGALEPSTITDATGKYLFSSLIPGQIYNVRQVLPNTWYQSSPVRNSAAVVTMASQLVATADFEDYQSAEVHGQVYRDVNGNSLYDAGDSGLAGWQVYVDANNNGLYDSSGIALLTSSPSLIVNSGLTKQDRLTVTGLAGAISDLNIKINITSLNVAGLSVVLIAPSGQRITLINTGDGTGQNFTNTVLDDQAGIQISSGVAPYTANFRPVGTLSLLNGQSPNGTWTLEVTDLVSGAQARLDSWTMMVATPSLAETVATTDANGNYILTGVVPGTYPVREVAQAGFVPTEPAAGFQTVTLATGQTLSGVNFGNIEPASISGKVWHDVNGDHVIGGTEPSLPGWTVTAFRDDNLNGVLDNQEVLLSTITDGNGNFSLSGLIPGQYIVSEFNQPTWVQLSPVATYTLNLNSLDTFTQANFAMAHQATLSGLVWQDTNADNIKNATENGLAGQTVYLDLNNNGAQDAGEPFAVTDATGRYSFANVNPGDYKIAQVLPAGWSQTVSGPVSRTLVSGGIVTDANFGDYQPGSIQGNVWQDMNADSVRGAAEPGLAGWTVYLDANVNGNLDAGEVSTLTDGLGNYSFLGLRPGSYRVAMNAPATWLTSTPVAGAYPVTIASNTTVVNQDFGEYQAANISGVVWYDVNLNGQVDAGEARMAGWKVDYFLDANGNGTADAGETRGEVTADLQGVYKLTNVKPGRYVVSDVIQSGYIQASPLGGKYLQDVASGANVANLNFGLALAPTATAGSFSTSENNSVSGIMTGSDPGGAPLTFVLTVAPTHGRVEFQLNGSFFTYTPDLNYNGPDAFQFQSNNGLGLSAPAVMTLVVTPVNQAPTAVPPVGVETNEDTAAAITLSGTDVILETPASSLVYLITTNPAHGTVTLNGNIATYTPVADYNGPDSFAFTVTDNGDPAGSHANPSDLTSAPAVVNLNVKPVNDAPVANNMNATVAQDQANVFALNGTDAETASQNLIYAITQQPLHGTVTWVGNIATYTPAAGFYGQDKFTYTVTDNGDPAGSNANPGNLTSPAGTVSLVVSRVITFDAKHPQKLFMAPNSPAGLSVTMTGPGTGKLTLTNFGLLDSRDIGRIELNGTSAATVLTIKTIGKVDRISKLGDIVVDGPAKSITVTGAQILNSVQVTGSLGKLDAKMILPGADITVGPAGLSKVGTAYVLGQVADLSITSAMPIASIAAVSWLDTDAITDVISAPSLGTLTTTGYAKALAAGNKRGDFQADLNLTAPGTKLKSVKVAGQLLNSNWDVNGLIGTIKVKQLAANSTIRTSGNITSITVGAADTLDVLASVNPLAGRHAVDAGSFTADSKIGSFRVTGFTGFTGQTFVNSNLSAARLGTVDLLKVDFAAGSGIDPFGLFAKQGTGLGVGTVRFKDANGKLWTWGKGSFQTPANARMTVNLL